MSIFISHSSANNAIALALLQWLGDNGWSEVFLDISETRGLNAGGKWQEELRRESKRCEAVIFVISHAWNDSSWCKTEFLFAKHLGKKILGVLVEDIPIADLPTELTSEWQLCDLVGGEERETFEVEREPFVARTGVDLPKVGLDALRRGLQCAGLEATTFPWPPEHEPERAPYRGLKPYDADDAAVFFGRDAAIARGLDQVRKLRVDGGDRMLVILGSSGAGKSSYMRAGLWPRLQRDDQFHVLPVVRPGRAAINGAEGLAESIAMALGAAGLTTVRVGDVRSRLRTDLRGDTLGDYLQQLRDQVMSDASGEACEPTFILPIDQAEELYASDAGQEAAQLRVQLSVACSRSGIQGTSGIGPKVLVLVTIRTDLYTHMQDDEQLRSIGRQMFDLTPMDRSEYKHVIEGPAKRASDAEVPRKLTIEPQLTEQLLVDTEGADALPMLAFTLQRLYLDFGGDGELTLQEYQELGGITGSLIAVIDAAMDAPEQPPAIPSDPVERQRLLRQAFIPWLAEIDEQTSERRRRVALWSEFPEPTHPILERLTSARLLLRDLRSAGPDGAQHEVVEVAHEALLRRWPELVNWLDADEFALRMVGVVSRAAELWAQNGCDDEYVVHAGERLREAQTLLARDDFSRRLGESGADYLARCQAVESAGALEKQRRQRFLHGALAVSLTLGALAAFLYVKADSAKQEAERNAEVAMNEKNKSARALSLMHANLSRQRTDKGYAIQGALLALEALPDELPENLDHPEVVEAEIALRAALESLQTKQILDGHEGAVVGATFSPNGKRVVTASSDSTARLWDVESGRQIASLKHGDDAVRQASFSPNGAWLITVASSGVARLWDSRRGYLRSELGSEIEPIDSAVFSSDGALVATTSGQSVRVRKVSSRCSVRLLRYGDDIVRGIAFTRDGAEAVTVSARGRLHRWEMPNASTRCLDGSEAQTAIEQWDTPALDSSTTGRNEVFVNFNADGSRILTVSDEKDIARLWDAEDLAAGRPLYEIKNVSSAAFSPDGDSFIVALTTKSEIGFLYLRSAENPQLDDEEEAHARVTFEAQEGNLRGVTFSVDGSRLLSISDTDNKARVWDVTSGRELAVLEGHWQPIVSASFSPDGDLVVTASEDWKARIHSVEGQIDTIALNGHDSAINTSLFSSDGKHLLTASADSTARIWDVDKGRETVRFNDHHNIVVSAEYSSDEQRVITASDDGTARIWTADDGKALAILDGDGYGFTAATFSPDGNSVATASWDGTARVWDVSPDTLNESGGATPVLKGTQAKIYRHSAPVTSVVFSKEGKKLVTASLDQTARIWDVETCQQARRFDGHEMSVMSAAPNADGTALVTASLDGTARIWDVESGEEQLRFKGSEHGFNGAQFSPDDKRVVTVADVDGVRLWDADSQKVEHGATIDDIENEPLNAVDNCDPSESGTDAHDADVASAVEQSNASKGQSSSGKELARLVIRSIGDNGLCDDAVECSVDANSARFNGQGSRVAVAADDNTVYLWETPDRKMLRERTLNRLIRRELTDSEKVRFHVVLD